MGIGDIGVSLWGECEEQDGMHLGAPRLRPRRADRPRDRRGASSSSDGATGELVLTHLRHRAAPLLRFRTRDHVEVRTSPCPCGRTGPRVRCIGRTDDMLIVRGVNVFPSAVREVVSGVRAARQRPHPRPARSAPGVKQEPPLPVSVELGRGRDAPTPTLAEAIRERLRERARRADARRARAVGQPRAQRVQVEARRALGRSADAEAPEPGRPPHHARRRRPADVDRLLGGRARACRSCSSSRTSTTSRRATSTSTRATGG